MGLNFVPVSFWGLLSECECSIIWLVLNGVFEIGADGWMFVSVFQSLAFLHKYARLRGKCQEMYYDVGRVFRQFGDLFVCCI